jgi:twitching motility protein PilT
MAIIDKVFKVAVDRKASDVHIAPGETFILRHLGTFIKLKSKILTPEKIQKVVFEILDSEQKNILKKNNQIDFAYEVEGLGRFRGSAMMHNNGLSAVFRVIPPSIPTLNELRIPEVVRKSLDNHQGLILVTGATGHGKSTTLAAMIDYLNTNRAHHVLTVEDPIEFLHPLKRCIINQRELSRDTLSYANALKGALRQDPDVIMIGELRDLDTIALAISAAETGHLVIGTLSTSSAPKTIDRIIDSFPPGEQNQIRAMLSESLKAVITQRLLRHKTDERMVLALEILLGNLSVGNLIRDAKTFQIHSVMQMSKKIGMQLMDDSILSLLEQEEISLDVALANAANKSIFQKYINK